MTPNSYVCYDENDKSNKPKFDSPREVFSFYPMIYNKYYYEAIKPSRKCSTKDAPIFSQYSQYL